MPFEVVPTEFPEVLLFKPRVFADPRGFFFESFNQRDWCAGTGLVREFVQDNHSRSSKGVLRGLHYQLPPAAQGKLVRVLAGEIFDVAVDIRRSSPTFGKWTGRNLSAENKLQMWIPEGFAHGFLVLSDTAEMLYKTTAYYDQQRERGLRWDDASLAINWPEVIEPLLSDKDANAPLLSEIELF